MEKYSKPVMVLEKIEDEVYTATADGIPNVPGVVTVSEEYRTDNQRSPFVTNVP